MLDFLSDLCYNYSKYTKMNTVNIREFRQWGR